MHTMREAKEINELARSVFLRDGCHVPIVIFFKGDNNAIVPISQFTQSAIGKDILSDLLRSFIKMFDISGIALIMEAWVRAASKKNPSLGLEDSGSNTDDKKEVLMVNVESDDGLKVMFMSMIVRNGSDAPSLSETEILEQVEGRFASFFPCTIATAVERGSG